MDSREISASSVTFILNHLRAAGSIGFNPTDLTALGKMWGSGTLINVGNGANVGDIPRNRMFYTKCMVSDQDPRRSNSTFLTRDSTGYISTLRMYSNCTKNTECLNSQNVM